MVAAYVQVTNADQHQDWTELMETAAQFVTMQVGAERAAQLMHTAKQLCVGQTPAQGWGRPPAEWRSGHEPYRALFNTLSIIVLVRALENTKTKYVDFSLLSIGHQCAC